MIAGEHGAWDGLFSFERVGFRYLEELSHFELVSGVEEVVESPLELNLVVGEGRHGLISAQVLVSGIPASWQSVVLISCPDVAIEGV